jgi:regulator of cell morphogenesis and NO signaling
MENTVQLGEMTVNEVIVRYPSCVEVFNRHGIDACCGGHATVVDAAERDGADAETVLAELTQLVGAQ